MRSTNNVLKMGIVLLSLCLFSCYSFKGVNIGPETKTYYVHPVQVTALDAPIDIQHVFLEAMRQKIQSQTSLVWSEREPNVEFLASVNGFTISTEAATDNNTVTLNKLTISVSVEYINNNAEKDTWKSNFSYGVPFDPNVDLNTVQRQFIDEIFDQITDQIFQQAFTQW